jgi:hypothetical protein
MQRLDYVRQQFEGNRDRYACYLHVKGGQPRSAFRELERMPGVKTLWIGSIIPIKWRWLLFWVPSSGALIRVFDSSKLRALFDSFADTSMLGVYICQPVLESKLVLLVKRGALPDEIHKELRRDPSYIFYIVDFNYPGSKTDIIEWFHMGQE